MTRRIVGLLLCLAALTVVGAACGSEEDLSDIAEGEAFDLGDLRTNVLFTRFLNANDVEDRDYLTGEPPAPPGKLYLGVFVSMENEGDDDATVPESSGFELTDTTDAKFTPIASESLYSMPFGETLEPGEEIPTPDSVAAAGPLKGAMIMFLVDAGVTENRPLELHITSGDEKATVGVDI
jgi:hypothetical protein